MAILIATGLTGCAQAATTIPDPNPCEIKFGLLISISGDLGDLGTDQLPGEQIAVDEINSAGGPLGCKIAVVTEDDQSTAEGALKGADKLVFNEGAITLLGLNSAGTVALMDFARANKVPILTQWGGTTTLDTGGGDYVFRTVLSDSFAGIGSAHFLIDQGYLHAANLYENGESPESNAKTMRAAFEARGGHIVAEVSFDAGQTSYQVELAQIFAASPEIVLLSAGTELATAIMREWSRGNYGGMWLLGSDLGASEIVTQIGTDVMAGQYGQTAGDDVSSPSYQRFLALWEQKTGKHMIAPFASNLYDSFIMEALAIQIAGEASGTAINEHMHEVTTGEVGCISYGDCRSELMRGHTIRYKGVSGPLQFNQYNNVVAPWTILIANGDNWEVFKFYSAATFAFDN